MQLTNQSIYAVEAMAHMAGGDQSKPRTVGAIAEAFGKSISYTEQMFARLRDAGLIRAERGPGGGYYLNRPAQKITIADIVTAFEDQGRTVFSRHPEAATAKDLNQLHGTELLWEALDSYTLLFLNGVSLADVTSEKHETSTSHNGPPTAAVSPRPRV